MYIYEKEAEALKLCYKSFMFHVNKLQFAFLVILQLWHYITLPDSLSDLNEGLKYKRLQTCHS